MGKIPAYNYPASKTVKNLGKRKVSQAFSNKFFAILVMVALLIFQNQSWAVVAFGSSGAVAVGTKALAVPHPAGIVAGDLLVLVVGNKHPPNGPTTPAGWTLVTNGQGLGGLGTNGGDRGPVYSTIFVKIALGTETGNLSVTLTSAVGAIGRMFRYTKTTAAAWDYAATNGADSTAGTDWSVTGAADPGISSGDLVIVGSVVNSNRMDDPDPWTLESVAATGATFGAATERQDSRTSAGNDLALIVSDHPVTAGTATAAPVFTMTGAPAGRVTVNTPTGPSVFLRIRESNANLGITKTNGVSTLVAGSTTTYTITATNGGPSGANGTIVKDLATAGLNCTTVTCSAAGGAACPAVSDIATLQAAGLVIPTFPANSTLTFSLTCGVTATGQ